MSNYYRLVEDYISHDTAEALVRMAMDAQNGLIIGAAIVCLLKGRRYTVNVYGACERNATFTRGCVRALDDCLEKIVHDKDPPG